MPSRLLTRPVALSLALALILPTVVRASPPSLAERVARLESEAPALLEAEALDSDWRLHDFEEARFEALLREIERGAWDGRIDNAMRVVFWVFAEQPGPMATQGRMLLDQVVGAAGNSGSRAVVRSLAALLADLMDDLANQYSLLARDLLATKVRCAAVSLSDDELFREVSRRAVPEFGSVAPPAGPSIGDRHPIRLRSDLYDVAAREGVVIAVGRFGTVLVSRDGGESWDTPPTGTDATLFAVAFGPGSEVWAVGSSGAILHSGDAGRSFEPRPSPFLRHLFGVHAPAPGTALAVGDYGLELRTEDAGRRWQCLPRDEDVILGRLVPAGDGALVVGEFGTLERRDDRGAGRQRGRLTGVPEDTYLFDAWLDAEGRHGLAVGLEGTVLRTGDGGATWQRVETGFSSDLYAVGGAGNLALVAGEGGFAAVSRDQGRSFEAVELPTPPVSFTAIRFADARRAYLVGPGGLVLATGDGARSFRVLHGER